MKKVSFVIGLILLSICLSGCKSGPADRVRSNISLVVKPNQDPQLEIQLHLSGGY